MTLENNGFTRIYWVLPSFERLNKVWLSNFFALLDFTAFLLGFNGFYMVLLGFIGFYWVLPGFTRLYWVLLGLNGFY